MVQAEEFDLVVAERAHWLASRPTGAIGLLKRVVDEGYGLPIEQALAHEEAGVRELTQTEDAAAGLQAFLDRRQPTFRGR